MKIYVLFATICSCICMCRMLYARQVMTKGAWLIALHLKGRFVNTMISKPLPGKS